MRFYHHIIVCLLLSQAFSQYIPHISKELAFYAKIAYENSDYLYNWSCQICHHYDVEKVDVFSDQKYNLRGITLYSKRLKSIVVAFRGTQVDNVHNIFTDGNIIPINYRDCEGCKVHMGFFQAFERLKTGFQPTVKRMIAAYPQSKIYVTGHSLGGALATLFVPEIVKKFSKNKIGGVYTYGQPRVGNRKFAQFLNNLVTKYRVIHKKDIVPQVPLKSTFQTTKQSILNFLKVQQKMKTDNSFEYYHGGKQIWYQKTLDQFKQCQSEDHKCYNSVYPFLLKVQDHSSSNYIQIASTSI